ncbi:hypothetical protein OSB04_023179 [Centaurea solstitialis]|uniref:Uncharacterized protein n=1 Tax=Centaurea solstitialis TaxID=347529 RepID=A0AA38VZC9_9ASTR|nr:hypothetical protein OSB04_023179 [Centaurea solstitialis]
MASRKRKISNDAEISALHKEWDEISCPICMDHPHNAVLIMCSSHEKGCRSFICDTSYRHSNCLDRFKKLVPDSNDITPTPATLLAENDNPAEANGTHEPIEPDAIVEFAGGPGESDRTSSSRSGLSLKCPLCRGSVSGWVVVEEARQYLNLKSRSCSQESCSFSGNYRDLRRHARRAHPTARPSDVDPLRERAWRRLEHQREYGDIVSAIRSAMPGAVVFGDYAIENGGGDNRAAASDGRERGGGGNNGHWWTAFFLFQMIGSMEPRIDPPPPADRRGGGRTRVPARHRRRRLLWGESLLGLQDDEEEDESDDDPFGLNLATTDNDEDRHLSENPRRRRRRLTRYRSDEDQS